MGTFSIKADIAQNIVFTTLEGFCSAEDLQGAPAVMKQEVAKLKKPFVAITDIQTFKSAQKEAQAIIAEGMRMALEGGMSTAIRIVTKKAILGSMQFQRISQHELGYTAITVSSIEEALEEARKHQQASSS